MIYKLLISLFILHGTFFAASGGNTDLESQRRTAASTSNTCSDMECPSGKTCAKGVGALWFLGVAGMKAGSLVTALLAYNATDNERVKKALTAAIVGDAIGIAGYTFASISSLCSGKVSMGFVAGTEAISWELSNYARWVAIGLEDNTDGVSSSLRDSSIISALTIFPGIGGVCCAAGGDKD